MEAVVAFGAAAAFAGAALLLSAFFATGDRRFDRVAEWAFVAFAGFAIALALVVQQRLGPETGEVVLVTSLGIAGVAVLGALELLSTLGRIDFQRYGISAALGFAAWLLWIAGVSALGLARGTLPVGLGWLGLAAVAASLIVVARFATDRELIRAERAPGLAEMAPLLAVFVGIVAWLVWLGLTL